MFPFPKLTKTGKGAGVRWGLGTLTLLTELAMEASRAEALATDRVTGGALLTLTNFLATRSIEAGRASWGRILVRPSQRQQKPLIFPQWAKDQIPRAERGIRRSWHGSPSLPVLCDLEQAPPASEPGYPITISPP